LFCAGVTLCLPYWGKNMAWGCSRIGCWGRYLGLRGRGDRGVEMTAQRESPWFVVLISYYSGDQIKNYEIRVACRINRVEMRCTKILLGKPEGKRPLGIPRYRWEDNIKMYIQEIGRVASNYFWTGWVWRKITRTYKWRFPVDMMRTLGFHRMREMSWLANKLPVSQEVLYFAELIMLSLHFIRQCMKCRCSKLKKKKVPEQRQSNFSERCDFRYSTNITHLTKINITLTHPQLIPSVIHFLTVLNSHFRWFNLKTFCVYGSVHRWSILITAQRDATQSSLFIILQVHSTCFGCQPHPSSGVHKTVTTNCWSSDIYNDNTVLFMYN